MTRNDIYTRTLDAVSSRNNGRLAAFVNVPVREVSGVFYMNYDGVVRQDQWIPQSDWNQLMLIIDEVEKIDNIQVVIRGTSCFIAKLHKTVENDVEMIEPTVLCQFDSGSRIESAYRCCVDFILNVPYKA